MNKEHKKALILIDAFNYNAREIAEVLGINTRTASDKIKNVNYNKFTEYQFKKMLIYFKDKNKYQREILEKLF